MNPGEVLCPEPLTVSFDVFQNGVRRRVLSITVPEVDLPGVLRRVGKRVPDDYCLFAQRGLSVKQASWN